MKGLYFTMVITLTSFFKGYCQKINYVIPTQVEKIISHEISPNTNPKEIFAIWNFNPEINKITLSFCSQKNLPDNYKDIVNLSNKYVNIKSHRIPIVLYEDFRFSSYIICDGCVVRLGGFSVLYEISYTIKGLNDLNEITE